MICSLLSKGMQYLLSIKRDILNVASGINLSSRMYGGAQYRGSVL